MVVVVFVVGFGVWCVYGVFLYVVDEYYIFGYLVVDDCLVYVDVVGIDCFYLIIVVYIDFCCVIWVYLYCWIVMG